MVLFEICLHGFRRGGDTYLVFPKRIKQLLVVRGLGHSVDDNFDCGGDVLYTVSGPIILKERLFNFIFLFFECKSNENGGEVRIVRINFGYTYRVLLQLRVLALHFEAILLRQLMHCDVALLHLHVLRRVVELLVGVDKLLRLHCVETGRVVALEVLLRQVLQAVANI